MALTGAGISAESGIPTFRGTNGLWEGHRVEDVATPGAWQKDPALVLEFYNMRRKAITEAQPNEGHLLLARLEEHFEVEIITQNIDDLHERAGSSNVLHLHGEIKKSRSSIKRDLIYDIEGWELKMGQLCELGSQLRPHIVWFGEPVPNIDPAAELVERAHVLLVIGTSLQVYPAAGLIHYSAGYKPKFLIDPEVPKVTGVQNLTAVAAGGGEGLKIVWDELMRLSAED